MNSMKIQDCKSGFHQALEIKNWKKEYHLCVWILLLSYSIDVRIWSVIS